jgi:hypothetical protein
MFQGLLTDRCKADVDWQQLATLTEGYSGMEMSNVMVVVVVVVVLLLLLLLQCSMYWCSTSAIKSMISFRGVDKDQGSAVLRNNFRQGFSRFLFLPA